LSAASLASLPAQSEAQFRRLVGAELLKLRRRRALLVASVALIVAPMVLSFIVLAIFHAADPAKYGPAGGVDNLRGALQLLTQIGTVAAVLIGVNAGGGDLGAGVFRELVVTGRSRLGLFAARIPGGLALLVPLVAIAFAIAATASIALAGPGQGPGAGLLLEYAGWVGLVTTLAFLLALGVSSLLDSRATSIGVLLAWQLAVAPLLLQTSKLDPVLLGAALKRLEPGSGSASISLSTAILLIAAWTVVPLAAGAWRTQTRDA
jgi:ABC-type transport system involved in multi-copper enzyme maturation permease subunit